MKTAVQETSINAYHDYSGTGRKRELQLKILNFIQARGGDWSIGELAQALIEDKSTISARLNELLYDTKELEIAPKRKDRVSGVTIRPVKLPAEQGEMAL